MNKTCLAFNYPYAKQKDCRNIKDNISQHVILKKIVEKLITF